MAKKKTISLRKKAGENLDDETIKRAMKLVEDGGTKKDACAMLNISYNTTRLKSIFEDYEGRVARRKARFSKNRGTPLSDLEIKEIVTGALLGLPISTMREQLFRSAEVIQGVIDRLNIPSKKEDTTLLPEECVILEAFPGSLVWSAKYQQVAEVVKETGRDRNGDRVYRVYLMEASEHRSVGGRYANQSVVELGSLAHLEKYINKDDFMGKKLFA